MLRTRRVHRWASFALLSLLLPPPAAAWDGAAGVVVTPASAARMPQRAVPDGAGGAFVVLGGDVGEVLPGVFVQRVDGAGARVAGWPAGGVQAGADAVVPDASCLPYALSQVSAAADGSGGAYVSW